MHRLRIVYAATEDYATDELQQITTRCTAKSACQVDIAAGMVSQTLSGTSTFENASASEALFLLPPQNSSDVTLTVVLAGKDVTLNLAQWLEDAGQAQTALEGGKRVASDHACKQARYQLRRDGNRRLGQPGHCRG